MRAFLFTHLLLGTSSVQARRTITVRQDGPTDGGIAPDCTYIDTVLDASWTCAFLSKIGVSRTTISSNG
jgi:hypothetical protein